MISKWQSQDLSPVLLELVPQGVYILNNDDDDDNDGSPDFVLSSVI